MSMPDLTPSTTGTVTANGAELYYELRGSGPALLLIPGASGDAGMYTRAAAYLAADYTVITYDRRGNSRSIAPDGWTTTSVDEQADDAAALIAALGLAPAYVFGNSSGATIAINLALRHPEVLLGVIAHEPPKIGTLPNRDEFLAGLKKRMADAVAEGGYGHAMDVFHGWLTGDDEDDDPNEVRDRVAGNGENWITRELGIVDRYDAPDALIKARTTPLVIGVGTTGGTDLHTELLDTYSTSLRELAEHLGAGFEAFTGAHVPYSTVPDVFATEVTRVLGTLTRPSHLEHQIPPVV